MIVFKIIFIKNLYVKENLAHLKLYSCYTFSAKNRHLKRFFFKCKQSNSQLRGDKKSRHAEYNHKQIGEKTCWVREKGRASFNLSDCLGAHLKLIQTDNDIIYCLSYKISSSKVHSYKISSSKVHSYSTQTYNIMNQTRL